MRKRRTSWAVAVSGLACLGLLLVAGCGEEDGGTTVVNTTPPDRYATGIAEIADGVANAGVDQTVGSGATVTLDASGSHATGDAGDPEGTDPTTYVWTLVSGPSVTFTTDAEALQFTAPSIAGTDSTTCVFQVEVDGTYTDTVSVTVKPVVVTVPEVWVGGYGVSQDITADVSPADTGGDYSYRWAMRRGEPLAAEWTPTNADQPVLNVITPLIDDLKVLPDDFGMLPIGGLEVGRATGSRNMRVQCTVYDPPGELVTSTLTGQGAFNSSAGETTLDLVHIERAMISPATTTVTIAPITGAIAAPPVYDSTLDVSVVDLISTDLGTAVHIGEMCDFVGGGAGTYAIVANTATTLTLDGDASGEGTSDLFDIELLAGAYAGQDCVFGTSGNIYAISANTATTLTLASTAAAEATDDVFRITPAALTEDHTGENVIFGTLPNKTYEVVSNTGTQIVVDGNASGEAADDDIEISAILAVAGYKEIHIVGWTTGGKIVPVGAPCFLNGGDGTSWAWSGTGNLLAANGVAGVLVADPTERVQMFVPPSEGDYTFVCTVDGTDVNAITVRAAKYVGVGSMGGRVPDADKGECAACHGGQFHYIGDQMGDWEQSGHAGIFKFGFVKHDGTGKYDYADFRDNSCIPCHVVGYDESQALDSRGDPVNGGFDDVALQVGANASIFYATSPPDYDGFSMAYPTVVDKSGIQCENCHGPGSTHNGSGGMEAGPIVGPCAQCHDDHGVEVRQENRSVHTGASTSRGTRSGCSKCHAGQGLPRFFRDGKAPAYLEAAPRTCGTCHDTHKLTNNTEPVYFVWDGSEWQEFTNPDRHIILRDEGDVTLPNGVTFDFGESAICVHCHSGRYDISQGTGIAPHAPHHGVQGSMLAGTGGIEYTGWTYVNGPHRAGTATDPGAHCHDCHMAKKAVSSARRNDSPNVGGHTWRMIFDTALPTIDQTTHGVGATLAGTREFAVTPGVGASFVGLVEAGDMITLNGEDALTDAKIEAVMSRFSVLISASGNFKGDTVTSWSITRTTSTLAEGCRACHPGGWPMTDTFAITASDDWDGDSSTETVQAEITGLLAVLEAELISLIDAKVAAAGTIALDTSHGNAAYAYVGGPKDGEEYEFPGPGEPNEEDEAWDAEWEQIWKAAYNYFFVLDDKSDGIHNAGYAVNLVQSTLDDLGALPANADPYVAP